MLKTILVPTDGSEPAAKAVAFAADLARRDGARVLLLHVVSDWGSDSIPESLRDYAQAEHMRVTERDLRELTAKQILEQAGDQAREKGAQVVETVIRYGRPVKAILQAAKDAGADIIVMGSRGLGDAEGLLLGSVSHKVCHLADCTCVTVK